MCRSFSYAHGLGRTGPLPFRPVQDHRAGVDLETARAVLAEVMSEQQNTPLYISHRQKLLIRTIEEFYRIVSKGY